MECYILAVSFTSAFYFVSHLSVLYRSQYLDKSAIFLSTFYFMCAQKEISSQTD